ncbi:MAG: Eco57I restriction-modification methylase domain-containing protein, partial [Candidatus Binataceae bacterium]
HMLDRLFGGRPPKKNDTLLDPGCGTGAFLAGILRWCTKNAGEAPQMVGIESEPRRASQAQAAFVGNENIEIRRADFLIDPIENFDFIVGNPPYVAIYGLSENEKREFRLAFASARGRFDLYLLFFERALKSLKPGGRMVFITPEKFLYVSTAAPLRCLLTSFQVDEIELVEEESFGDLITYPTITTIINRPSSKPTSVRLRDGTVRDCALTGGGASWMPIIRGVKADPSETPTLKDICVRVSCGVATGADEVFVRQTNSLEPGLAKFALPTIAGRELTSGGQISNQRKYSILAPYSENGKLLPEQRLGALGNYLRQPHIREQLEKRSCVRHKPWYAFHETPPLREILRPKILCKDITETPHFWIDETGVWVPRHSVYYIVPLDADKIESLCAYLNSPRVAQWLIGHCQRAASGFLRLQSNILKALPIPDDLAPLRYRRSPLTRQLELRPEVSASGSAASR